MLDELFIDEQGRFQMASNDLTDFVEFLVLNRIQCSPEVPNAFTTAGQTYGYARLQHLYDADLTADLHRHWMVDREESRVGQPQRR